jgi:hypothetical protein
MHPLDRKILIIAVPVLAALLFLLLSPAGPSYFSAIRPTGITNMHDHFSRWGQPKGIYRRERSGTNVFIFVGLTNKLPSALPSGPPAYVYSSSGPGLFLDWTPDLGDDPEVHERWSGLWPKESDIKLGTNEVAELMERFSVPASQATR